MITIILFISIQIILLVNNRQKTSFRYFIWNIQEVSIGRLISISFISGLLLSSIFNKTLQNNIGVFPINEKVDKTKIENNYSNNTEDYNESKQMPPERDLRDTQPTISVNYRVIKDNGQNESNKRNQSSQDKQYEDDWNIKDSEW